MSDYGELRKLLVRHNNGLAIKVGREAVVICTETE